VSGRKPRRVLIIVENLPVPFDRRVWLEACALRDAGYEVSVICPKGKNYTAGHEVIDGIFVYRHPLPFEGDSGALGFVAEYSIAFLWELLLAWRVFLTRGFDVVHACNPPDNIFLIGLVFKLFGVKFVFDQHDINPELYIAKYGRTGPLYHVLLWFERMTYATANLVISTNKSYRAIALTRGKKRAEMVHIVRSAPDTLRFRAVDADPALREGRKHLVAYVGVMGKQEGIDLLLDAVRHIVTDCGRTDVLFALIGSGPEKPHMEEYARKTGVESHVRFTGRIPDADLLRYLSTADVCVNPDRVNEMNDKSTMNKIMEYMAVGKPVVQFEMTEGRFSAGEASAYARPNDATDFAEKVLELLDAPERRKTMGEFGRQRMEAELDWRFSREALLRAYATLD
jgi:glycosyltransferase involved in cell wall biosynthesis